jgi:phage terminase large subunit GpA-like protein
MARSFPCGKEHMPISVGLVDSGYRTDEVYQLCLRHPGRLWPAKGGDFNYALKYSPQTVVADPANHLPLGGEVMLVLYTDDRWKSLLLSRFRVEPGNPGYWSLEAETDEEWFHQMQGEQLRRKPNTKGVPVYYWHRSHDQHSFDCEKLQVIAQEVFQIASLAAPPPPEKAAQEPEIINPYTNLPVR